MLENLNNYYFVVIIILTILLIFTIFISKYGVYESLIDGFYDAEQSFCDEAELDIFCLYIDNDSTSDNSHACYILMMCNGVYLINEPSIMKINGYFSNIFAGYSDPKYYDVEFSELSEATESIFPSKQTMRFYPQFGKIVLYSEDTITAVMYKNNVNSELKSLLAEEDK
jgi:hypothetical protein